MKVEENLVVLPPITTRTTTKRRQSYYLPMKQDQKHQFKIDDFLLKKKKRSNENDLIRPCAKKAKMLLNPSPFNKFHNYYLFDSSDHHCTSHSKISDTSNHKINKINNQNNINQNNHLDAHHSTNQHTNHSSLFNRKTNLPLSSSPIPQHKQPFNFERSIKSHQSNAIQRAILNKEPETDENFNLVVKKQPNKTPISKNLLGNFEENLLNERFDAVQTIFGKFRAEIGTSGKLYNNFFCPDHLKIPVTVYFYNIDEGADSIYATPYLAKVNLEKKGYLVPRKGNVQVTLFNPEDNIVKMFVVQYDLSDMPSNSQSFIRQKTYYMPKSINLEGKLAAGSNKPNQTNQKTQAFCEPTQSNLSSNSNKQNSTSNAENLSPISQANSSNNLSNLPTSLTTTDLSSNLPTNLTGTKFKNSSSKTYSISSSSSKEFYENKLCNTIQFKSSWLRYLIHLRFISTKSGKIYLHRDIRILILKKNEFDPGNLTGQKVPTYHWVTEQYTEMANSPKYSLR